VGRWLDNGGVRPYRHDHPIIALFRGEGATKAIKTREMAAQLISRLAKPSL
jgi:hypothetical protein